MELTSHGDIYKANLDLYGVEFETTFRNPIPPLDLSTFSEYHT